jgi:hypothetical protein
VSATAFWNTRQTREDAPGLHEPLVAEGHVTPAVNAPEKNAKRIAKRNRGGWSR